MCYATWIDTVLSTAASEIIPRMFSFSPRRSCPPAALRNFSVQKSLCSRFSHLHLPKCDQLNQSQLEMCWRATCFIVARSAVTTSVFQTVSIPSINISGLKEYSEPHSLMFMHFCFSCRHVWNWRGTYRRSPKGFRNSSMRSSTAS